MKKNKIPNISMIGVFSAVLIITSIFAAMADEGSKKAEELFSQGVVSFNGGKYSEAADYFESSLKINPDSIDAHFGLGASYNMLGRYKQGAEVLNRAVDINPVSSEPHHGLSIFYKKLSSKTDAIETLKRSIGLRVTKGNYSIDLYSVQCIECHKDYLADSGNSHPIGVLYTKTTLKVSKGYNLPTSLNRAIRFFNGKIGCGTCHKVDSKEKSMLVMTNDKDLLCSECHIK